MTNQKRLGIYLNDHLAGSVAGRALAKRALSRNRGNDYSEVLSHLLAEIEHDQRVLRDITARLGISRAWQKEGAAWAVEKIGRLKLNGQLRGYSPLSRLLELESLSLGIEGKLALWRSLKQVSSEEPRLASVDFDTLQERAKRQLDELETHRLRAAATALRASR